MTAVCHRLAKVLPLGYAFFIIGKDGEVETSGISDGTLFIYLPSIWEKLKLSKIYPYIESQSEYESADRNYLWIKIPIEINLPTESRRSSRDILNTLLSKLDCEETKKDSYRKSINGIIGYVNGALKNGKTCYPYSKESLYSGCIQRFLAADELEQVTSLCLFKDYLSQKVREIFLTKSK
jgi:hypothetical protein